MHLAGLDQFSHVHTVNVFALYQIHELMDVVLKQNFIVFEFETVLQKNRDFVLVEEAIFTMVAKFEEN